MSNGRNLPITTNAKEVKQGRVLKIKKKLTNSKILFQTASINRYSENIVKIYISGKKKAIQEIEQVNYLKKSVSNYTKKDCIENVQSKSTVPLKKKEKKKRKINRTAVKSFYYLLL